ncbi:uncharacterized protein JN550_013368 [Neoarthrinium moseri]|uniref:uncharacterized protein n=1 Tax=Neoarthrinium moseri TaxID=1658444 RepID=UPI001FDB7FCF|nr:uncharacterized protein JN550_013368 [Neoarthrinium moseri]KAI1857233.1 hypothetical protein JN550_013368 [Neoarthrinium moseri]
MKLPRSDSSVHDGDVVKTSWSSNVIVLRILYTVTTSRYAFHGVLAKNLDWSAQDEPNSDELLWVYNIAGQISLWQEMRQRPKAGAEFTDHEIQEIIGHYELEDGRLFYAIKWAGYECPTWEPEGSLGAYKETILDYWLSLSY